MNYPDANCVVMSVNYRHAPELPYPAAVKDAIDALQWVVKCGKDKLDVDMTRIAVGGISAYVIQLLSTYRPYC